MMAASTIIKISDSIDVTACIHYRWQILRAVARRLVEVILIITVITMEDSLHKFVILLKANWFKLSAFDSVFDHQYFLYELQKC